MAQVKKYSAQEILQIAKKVFQDEAHALKTTQKILNNNFL